MGFEPGTLGKTGFMAGPLGLGSSYGVGAKGVEMAYERGVNYFYWAWRRSGGMRDALRHINKTNRGKVFITITSLLPTETMIRYSVHRALKALGTDYMDALQFYLRKDKPVMPRLQLDAALKLKDEGKVRYIAVTGHHRPNFPRFAGEVFSDVAHVRYNAIHRGAEQDVFPRLPPKGDPARPGVVAFTVTSWRQLIKARPEKIGGLRVPTAGDCYRFAMSHPDVDVALSGPADEEQTRHALDAVDRGPMTEEELEWMRDVGRRLYKK